MNGVELESIEKFYSCFGLKVYQDSEGNIFVLSEKDSTALVESEIIKEGELRQMQTADLPAEEDGLISDLKKVNSHFNGFCQNSLDLCKDRQWCIPC